MAASDDEITASMREMIREAAATMPRTFAERAQLLAGLLWPRGVDIRQRALQSYNPFRRRRFSDPALVRSLFLDEPVPEVDAGKPQWRQEFCDALATHGTAQLWTERGAAGLLREALVKALVQQVEVGFLRFFSLG